MTWAVRRLFAIAVVAALLALAPEAAWAQCAMCRTALESPEGAALAGAFRRGVFFLLGVPFGIVGTVVGLVLHERRRARQDPGFQASPAGPLAD